MAWEDALQLTHSLCNHGLTPEALREYEEMQQKRVGPISVGSRESLEAFYKEGRPEKMPLDPKGLDQAIMQYTNTFNFSKPVRKTG